MLLVVAQAADDSQFPGRIELELSAQGPGREVARTSAVLLPLLAAILAVSAFKMWY